jgi:two-component system cell cycle sensor histidine kinase PleC
VSQVIDQSAASAPVPDRLAVDAFLLANLFKRVKPLLIANVGTAWFLVAMLWGDTDNGLLVLWAAVLSAWTTIRYVLARTYMARPRPPRDTRRWAFAFAVGAGIGGSLWGVSVLFFGNFDIEQVRVLLVFVMAGLSAAALSGYANNLLAFLAFVIPALTPYGVALTTVGGDPDPWIAGFFVMWLVMVWVMARNLNTSFRESVGIHLKNAALVDDLTEARDRAEAASRAKSRFLGNMSHELRTPLNAIIGYAEMMAARVLGPLGNDHYASYAEDIRGSGQRLLDIVQGVLDVARAEAGSAELDEEPVDLIDLVFGAVAGVRETAAGRGIEIEAAIAPQVGCIRADPAKLGQAFDNLLANAVNFTPGGGCVRFGVHGDPDGNVVCTIEDDGIGMTADQIARAIRPFGHHEYQDPTARKPIHVDGRDPTGVGLGLCLARLAVELHGGRLEIASEPGAGTVVRIVLPAELQIDGARSGPGRSVAERSESAA